MKPQILNTFFDIKKPYFTIGYFLILLLDILVKLNLEPFPFRYITKVLLILSLLIFYLKNHKTVDKNKHHYMVSGLLLFLFADIVVINHLNTVAFVFSMIFFILGKVGYCLRFTNSRDFKLIRLVPFLLGSFFIMVFVFMLIYKNLGSFFIPVLTYFFVSLLLFLFAYLRKGDVNTKSYVYVLIAMFFFLLSEIIMALKTYYAPIPLEKITIMLSYGIAQYLIVYGISIEVKLIEDD